MKEKEIKVEDIIFMHDSIRNGCKLFMVQVATEELKEKAKKLSINRHTLSYLTNFNWYSLPYSKLKQIYNIIKSEEK